MSKKQAKNQLPSQKQSAAPRKKYLFYTILFLTLAVAGFFSAYFFSKIYGNNYSEIVGNSEPKEDPQQDEPEPENEESASDDASNPNAAADPTESPNKSAENNNNPSPEAPKIDYSSHTIHVTSAGVDGDYVYASAEISGLVESGQSCTYVFSSKSSSSSATSVLSGGGVRTNVSTVNGPSTASCKEGRIPKSRLSTGDHEVTAQFKVGDKTIKSSPRAFTIN